MDVAGSAQQAQGPRRPSQTGRYRPPKRQGQPVWLVPLVVLGALIVVVLAYFAQRGSKGAQATAAETASVLAATTTVPPAAWDGAGAVGATAPALVPAAQRTAGAPTLLYMGGEFCPYCAAERWVLVSSLSRFGSFSGLQLITSSSTDIFPNTPTFGFAAAKYQSPTIHVQTVEMYNRSDQALQTPTAAQTALLNKYDTSGDIPFILVGGQYVWSTGSQYSPGLLAGLSWTKVAGQLASGTSLGKTILANGNVISAAICSVDGGKPASVCQSAGVQAGAALLPKGPA